MLPKGPAIKFLSPVALDFSVVVPIHRERRGLRRCLKSVLDQMLGTKAMELLIVDHSPDHVAEKVWESLERPCGYYRVAPMGTMAGDWNLAVSMTSGSWVHLLHDDDFVDNRFYESLYSGLPTKFGVQSTGYRNVELGQPKVYTKEGDEANVPVKVTFERKQFELPLWPGLAISNQFQPSAVVVARRTYENLGGYITPENGVTKHAPDWEFYARTAEAKIAWFLVQDILANHTEGSGECESAAPWSEQIEGYRSLLEYFFGHGVQRDALGAGVANMLSVVMKRVVKEGADIPEAEAFGDKRLQVNNLVELAISLERQRRKYVEK